MRKPFVIVSLLLPTGLVLLILLADRIPGYGIKSRWKKITLHTMLSNDVPKISVQDAVAELDSALFLDTRTKEEYNVSHIKNAVFADYTGFDISTLNGVHKAHPIITYCSIGKRSDVIAKKLLQAGFTNVQNMYGGVFEWVNKGYTVVDGQNKPTRNVHAFNWIWSKWLNRGEKIY